VSLSFSIIGKQESGTLEGKYLLACELYDVVPCSFFLKHMHDQEVILRHYGLGNLGAKAIAFALRDNMSTLTLEYAVQNCQKIYCDLD
jgi:hypothetical protein